MDLYRLRIEVADDPGRLGRVLVALGRLGVNVVEIDCQNVDGTVRVDDLLVHLTRPLDVPAIGRAVEQAGCRSIDVRPLSLHHLQDPLLALLDAATQNTSTEPRVVQRPNPSPTARHSMD